MNKFLTPILLSLACLLFFVPNVMAVGWFILFFGIFYAISLILQLIIIWKHYNSNDIERKFLYITITLFLLFCLFREDFGDSSDSASSGISVISYYLGFTESTHHSNSSNLGSLINYFWLGLIVYQIFGLIKYRNKNRTLDNK